MARKKKVTEAALAPSDLPVPAPSPSSDPGQPEAAAAPAQEPPPDVSPPLQQDLPTEQTPEESAPAPAAAEEPAPPAPPAAEPPAPAPQPEPPAPSVPYSPMEQVRAQLRDLEADLLKQVQALQQNPEAAQSLCETVRLGAARLLQRAQACMTDVGLKLDAWDAAYKDFLKEKAGLARARGDVNALFDKVEQERVTLFKVKQLSDMDFQRLIDLCRLPEDRFNSLLS